MQARRSEIEVTKLVGGTNGFVRRPFLYTGALFGGLGALLAFGFALGTWLAGRTPDGTAAFQRLTFRRGFVLSARFTPDGDDGDLGGSWDVRFDVTAPARLEAWRQS